MNQVMVKPGQIVRHDIELSNYPSNVNHNDGILLISLSLGVLLMMFLWRNK